jgi:hypothetical protein
MRFIRVNGQIDLQAPIYMTDEQFERLKVFIMETFHQELVEIQRIEPDREWNQPENIRRERFTPEEMYIMLRPGRMEDKIRELKRIYPDRNEWTVEIKIGDIFPTFNRYLRDNGIPHVTREVVRQFLEDMGWL